ncbi:unnamed protein product, partial [Rotaria sp. Silwood1]
MALNLHRHNAKLRIQDNTLNLKYVQEEYSKVMIHPSYQPGPGPSDFSLSSCLKPIPSTYSDAASFIRGAAF